MTELETELLGALEELTHYANDMFEAPVSVRGASGAHVYVAWGPEDGPHSPAIRRARQAIALAKRIEAPAAAD
jgi:hypothetical protein